MTIESLKKEIENEEKKVSNLKQKLAIMIDSKEKNKCFYTEKNNLCQPSCSEYEEDAFHWIYFRHFKYCPYCGKEVFLMRSNDNYRF